MANLQRPVIEATGRRTPARGLRGAVGPALLVLALSTPAAGQTLVDAARAADWSRVEAALESGVTVDERQGDGSTALHWATYWDEPSVVARLLDAGADANVATDLGVTPLWAAAEAGNATLARRLLEAGARADAVLPSGESIVMTAAQHGAAEIVEALLAHGADPDRRAGRGQTALMWAAAAGHPEVVRVLLTHGADPDLRSDVRTETVKTTPEPWNPEYVVDIPQGGYTALLFAARSGDVASARWLLDHGADVNDTAPYGTSALVVAAHSGRPDVARLLLERGADPDGAGAGYTALHAAILYKDESLVEALLAHGADPDLAIRSSTPVRRDAADFHLHPSWVGATPYWLAARFSAPGIMRRLAAHGADPLRVHRPVYWPGSLSVRDDRRQVEEGDVTPLMAAVGLGGRSPLVSIERLDRIAESAPVRSTRREPDPDLVEAVTLEVVTVAVGHGVSVHVANAAGDTALHAAAARGDDSVVTYLVEQGADLLARNGRGQTPLDRATESRRGDTTVELLRELTAQAEAETVASRGDAAETGADDGASHQALLQRYCVACHNEEQRRRDLVPVALDAVDLASVGEQPALWESVVRKLRARVMPPAGRPRPDEASYDGFVRWLEDALDRAAEARPDPGRPAVRRLTAAEYRRAIHSLLDLEVDESWLLFPADDTDETGFATNGDMLSVSPALFDRYLSAANRISRLAVGDSSIGPSFASASYSAPRLLYQDDRASEALPFGARGGLTIQHHFPLDGAYEVTIRLRRMIYDYIVGMGRAQQVEVRLDGALVESFTVGDADRHGYPSAYTFFGTIRGDPGWEEYVSRGADAGLTVRFPVRAGPRTLTVSFVQARTETTGILERRLSGFSLSGLGFYDGNAAVERVEVTGPFDAAGPGDTPSRRRIFTCHAEDDSVGADTAASARTCAREILSPLARRAYRRPVTADDLDTLLAFYDEGARESGFERGVQKALERLLVAPEFLYRVERDPAGLAPGEPYRLSDLELATRLSLFLWSDLPDDELLSAAEAGTLSQRDTRQAQTRRLLAAPGASALVEEFASQWLQLKRIRGVAPDADLFYEFDENLRADMERETLLFLESQIREDRGVPELLTARHTFVNERLARHYGLEGVHGERFRRVSVDPGQRGGLLGQASLLTLTSYPTRTSPVLRGKWVLDNLLGMPPAPPPPDVPNLADNHGSRPPQSVRERLEAHRASPACASCHRVIDPLGFALERYDAVGRWRDTSLDGVTVDAAGVLADGTRVDGPAALRAALTAQPEAFVRTVTEKLLTYAIGRSLEPTDQPAVRRIVREAAADGYRWSSIIGGVVESRPFQMRRTES